MPAGTLEVTPVAINGLAQNGFPTSQTFIGCYVSPSEKQRTNSAQGPDPQFHDTIKCNVSEIDHEVTFDVVNEDSSRPGPIGYAKVELQKLFSNPRFEDWVPLSSMTGGPLGHLYVKMNFTGSSSSHETSGYGQAPPPPPAYEHNGNGGFPDEKRSMQQQGSFHSSLGPQSPMPTQYGMGQAPDFPRQEPIRYNSQSSLPGGDIYNRQNPNDGVVPPPVYTPPPVQTPAPVQTPEPVPTPEPVKTKKKMPDWMKYGGAALAGAAVAAAGSWAVHEALEDSDEEKEKQQHITSQHYQAPPQEYPHHQQRSYEEEEGYRSESYQQHYVPPEEEEEREEEEREEREEEEEEESSGVDDSMWQ
ncbi:hypothetical protein K501DRAFT_288996 [Backusella circina FSU 941]|nr:hypothetical protein K501DRAFT_288996 [Backusella circina FSU 941]